MNEGWEEKLESFYYSSVLTRKYRGKRWEDDEDWENCIGKGN